MCALINVLLSRIFHELIREFTKVTYAVPRREDEETVGGGEPLNERFLEPSRHHAERLNQGE